MQNKEIMVAYIKFLKDLLTRADPYNVVNNVDEMLTYVPCKQRFDSCTDFGRKK